MNLSPGKNIRLFQNDILEKFTYVHPIMPIAIWGPVAIFLMYYSIAVDQVSTIPLLTAVSGGLFFWTLSEYSLHRFVFHFKPKNSFVKRLVYLIHEVHHEDPNDARRLLMPPIAAVFLAIGFYSLFWFFLGNIYVKPFFAAFLTGYLCYDYIHFATHFSTANNRALKWLKRHHMLHHFKSPDQRYGVSSHFWDIVFKTFPKA